MDGRFAPSPSGPLHLGSLRTALVAWLFARSAGSRFLLRIEDLDPDRIRERWIDGQLADLRAIGLDWDGAVLRQSALSYDDALGQLKHSLYPCFCTRAQLRAARETVADGLVGGYPGTCRRLSGAERRDRIAAGQRYALRFDAGGERVSFNDALAGEQTFTVDDFIVRRADGVIAYQLAVVVDDHRQGVQEVVRGADLLDSTGRQILLQRALGLPAVRYAHVPLVIGPDGRRLAKRHGCGGEPIKPETLAWLGESLGLGPALKAAELIPRFDPALLPTGPVSSPAA